MNLKKLHEPFENESIEWRVQQSGKKGDRVWAMVLCYVTNRAIMDRLDDVCGPHLWRNEYREAPQGGVMCGLSIKVGDEWITKWDGAENTDIEGVKGGLSGAMKRAAVQWGIGRYLYRLDATFAKVHPGGKYSSKDKKSNTWFKWDPPSLPAWALPNRKAQPEVVNTPPKPVTPDRFADLPKERQDKARAQFFAVAGELAGDAGDAQETAYEICSQILTFDSSKGRASLKASTVPQVAQAINHLKQRLDEAKRNAHAVGLQAV